jgi:hypothetical protein
VDELVTPHEWFADVLLGAVVTGWNEEASGLAKTSVRDHVAELLGWRHLRADTKPSEWKFNTWFFFDPKEGKPREAKTWALKTYAPEYSRVLHSPWQAGAQQVEEVDGVGGGNRTLKARELHRILSSNLARAMLYAPLVCNGKRRSGDRCHVCRRRKGPQARSLYRWRLQRTDSDWKSLVDWESGTSQSSARSVVEECFITRVRSAAMKGATIGTR